MKITYIGHSCFCIEEDGYKIVTDPYKSGMMPGLGDVCVQANMVLASHEHDDHNARGEVEVIDGGVNPFKITEIETYHDECKGEKRGKTKIFVIENDNNKIVHFGDVGCDVKLELSREELEKIANPDIAMIPVGGKYTIDGEKAAELADYINPKLVIPMHYRNEDKGFGLDDIATINEFVALVKDVVEYEKSWLDTSDEIEGWVNILLPSRAI